MSVFVCPLCREELTRGDKSYACPKGHSFDISAAGYVHLLPANKKHSAAPGDDREMSRARREFLEKGYYAPLRSALEELAAELFPESGVLLDAGCGEGYYTAGVFEAVKAAGKDIRAGGIDISKFILKYASKKNREVEYAVASSYHLPVAGESVDLLLDCFAPLALEEFRRVLRPGGIFIYVVPAARHLWQMKQVLYDRPYENEEKLTPYEGFEYLRVQPVDRVITVDSREDIENLFKMTPYFWKTPREGKMRLEARERLETEISFRIHVFRRV